MPCILCVQSIKKEEGWWWWWCGMVANKLRAMLIYVFSLNPTHPTYFFTYRLALIVDGLL